MGLEYRTLDGYFVPIRTIDDLMTECDAVVVGVVSEPIGEFWPPSVAELHVQTQFEVRVEEVLSGDVSPGSSLVLHLLGGTMAKWGDPTPGGSFRPREGEETVTIRYREYPFPQPGERELMFLSRIELTDGTSYWVPIASETRFSITQDGSLASVLRQSGEPSSGLERWLLGGTLNSTRHAVRAWTNAR
jgi:hypothetical protein